MDHRYHPGTGAGTDQRADRLSAILSGPANLQKLQRAKRFILKSVKVATVPFAAVSSSFLFSSRASAASPVEALTNMATKSVFHFPVPEKLQAAYDWFDGVVTWFQNLPDFAARGSINLMSSLYELCATLILKTPLWIFDNQWFQDTTYLFSLISLGLVTILTILESMKRMVSGLVSKRKAPPMDFKVMMKRWGIVALGTAAVPFLFLKTFQLLNMVSDFLISMGATNMKNLAAPENISGFDILTLMTFDVVLISTLVPVLWQNGRRFFDLMILAVTAPLALTAWIFDPYRHLFRQWWEQVKHLSLVQVYYALFLLVLGWFIFGVPTPTQTMALVAKLLVVVGGFARMVNPPRIISKHLYNAGGLDEVVPVSSTYKKVKGNFKTSKAKLTAPVKAAKAIATKGKSLINDLFKK